MWVIPDNVVPAPVFTTVTGTCLSLLLVPSPSRPSPFDPQQRAVESARTAQVWLDPAEMWVTPDNVVPALVVTATGTERLLVVPSPSSPLPFDPQQRAVESARTAQVWELPAEMWVTPDNVVPAPVFTTVTGTDLLVVVPSPSRPRSFVPQQRAVESARTAQVWFPPAEMWVIPDNVVPALVFTTVTGTELGVLVPSPSRPLTFDPQQRAVVS
jgi:hypothetical protein